MNTLQIYTRSYIRDDGTWSMSEKTIASVRKLLDIAPKNSVKWLVFISGLPEESRVSEIKQRTFQKFADLYYDYPDQVNEMHESERYSTGRARQYLFDRFHMQYRYHRELMQDYFMNLDDDDELTNQNILLSFINDPCIQFNDLIGFGLDVPENSKMRSEWYWDIDKFNYSRKYVTTDTQTMFLFLHSFKAIQRLLTRGFNLSKCVSEPYECAEDSYIAIAVSEYNKGNQDDPILVDAICANFIKYNIHENQTSNRQTDEERKKVHDKLLEVGYLYVTGSFYKLAGSGHLLKFIPQKSKAI